MLSRRLLYHAFLLGSRGAGRDVAGRPGHV